MACNAHRNWKILLLALEKIAQGKESDWGYDHPEQKMILHARNALAEAKEDFWAADIDEIIKNGMEA